MTVDNEECLGCGTEIEGLDEHGTADVWSEHCGEYETYRLCLPCCLAQHSWRTGRTLDPVRAHISACTNLVLAAIKKAHTPPPTE
jgi:hypothetical protein